MRPRARSLYTLVGCSCSDVVQKLSVDSRQVAALSLHGVESCLVTVMAAVNNDASLLHCALRSLINLAHQSVPSALLSVCLSVCLRHVHYHRHNHPVHRMKWRHRIYGHDTFAILWVQLGVMCGVNGWRFTMLFKWNVNNQFQKMSAWSLTYRQGVFKRQQSSKHF